MSRLIKDKLCLKFKDIYREKLKWHLVYGEMKTDAFMLLKKYSLLSHYTLRSQSITHFREFRSEDSKNLNCQSRTK